MKEERSIVLTELAEQCEKARPFCRPDKLSVLSERLVKLSKRLSEERKRKRPYPLRTAISEDDLVLILETSVVIERLVALLDLGRG